MAEILTLEGFAFRDGKAHERISTLETCVNEAKNHINEHDSEIIGLHNSVNGIHNRINEIHNSLNEIESSSAIVTPEMYGAYGDGVSDDTDAINQAISSNKIVVFDANKVYLITSPIRLKNNIIFNNTTIKKSNMNKEAFNADDTIGISLSNVKVIDDANSWLGCLRARRVENLTIRNVSFISESPHNEAYGSWAYTISGKNIAISDVYVENYVGGYWHDGFHFGYVENLTMNNFIIYSGDDCLAFIPHPSGGTSDFMNLPSKNIEVSNGVLYSSDANCFKFGACQTSEYENDNHYVDAYFSNIVCVEGSHNFIRMDDDRTAAVNGHRLTFNNVKFETPAGSDTRVTVNIVPTTTGLVDSVVFKNCEFHFGSSSTRIALYKANKYVFDSCLIEDKGGNDVIIKAKDCAEAIVRNCTVSKVGAKAVISSVNVAKLIITDNSFDIAADTFAFVVSNQHNGENKVFITNNYIGTTVRGYTCEDAGDTMAEFVCCNNVFTPTNFVISSNVTPSKSIVDNFTFT